MTAQELEKLRAMAARTGEQFGKPEINELTPDLVEWAKQLIAEEEVVANLRELREKGGQELSEFIQELERIADA